MEKVAKTTLTLVMTLLSITVWGQKKIETFKELIEHIDQNTKYSFSYPKKLSNQTLSIEASDGLDDPAELVTLLEPFGIKVIKRGKTLIFRQATKPIPAKTTNQPRRITGYVRDSQSGESLIGANVIDMKTGKGVVTNVYGFFSLSMTGDSLSVGYVGYENEKLTPQTGETDLVIELNESEQMLHEVVVTDHMELQEESQMSTVKLSPEQIKAIPVFMGESDIMKALQLLPGIQSGNEGTSGMYVRGGGPDQNLILLDGVPVYNANHLFGFFSVFNTDAINNVEMIKGGFPARYGGRLSSVIDIQMKEGNLNQVEGEGAVGLIASKLTVSGPINKGKTSYMLSGRRTYLDLLTVPIAKAADDQQIMAYNFWDLNGKVNHIFSPKDRIYLSAYAGRDRYYQIIRNNPSPDLNEKEDSGLYWGNITSAFRWNHKFSDRLFSNLTTIYTRYQFGLNTTINVRDYTNADTLNIYRENGYFSNINDLGLKYDFNFYLNNQHQIRFGANYLHHTMRPGISEYKSHVQSDTTFGAKRILMDEYFVYVEDDIALTPGTKVNVGAHFSGAMVDGKSYTSLQPRVTINQKLASQWSLKASYASMTQYIHLLVNSGVGLPTDLWVPSTRKVKPQTSDQYAVGGATTQKGLEISIEGYYKEMHHLVEYKDGAGFLDIVNEWEDKLEFGKGESYGVEFLVQKKQGKSTGWIGYTWSKSNREFANLNYGKPFPYRYDRRHDVSLMYNLKINERIDFGAVWVYGTGNAITLPTSTYPKATWDVTGLSYEEYVKNYPGRNSARMKDYHRLDLSVSFAKKKKWGERKWVFGLYNTYSRLNPAFVSFEDPETSEGKGQFKQISLFPVIPNVSYQFKF